jgi:uncharacterized protein (DUF924 family)
MAPRAKELRDFWLKDVGEDKWYVQDAGLDATIRERWMSLWEEGAAGGLSEWVVHPKSTLSLIVLLDQFPRNMFRGDARAFSTDTRARTVAKEALLRGFDQHIERPQRQFFYLPLEHSEHLSDQDRSVRMFLINFGRDSDLVRHARTHREIIRTFGRFPFRNEALGRPSTPEEVAFIDAGGYRTALEKIPA